MIMPRGQPLLLPASPAFIWGSLLVALMLNLLPLGRVLWMPDFLAVVLVFWNIHQPRRIGLGVAFVFGLLLDVHQASLLGQHALAYTVLIYCAIMIHRRILGFSGPGQALRFALLPSGQDPDDLIRAGGHVAVDAGTAPDADAVPTTTDVAEEALDFAACIGCGACVAACPNGSAHLFAGAKLAHLALLPIPALERRRRARSLVDALDELFGPCSLYGECAQACPAGIPLTAIAVVNRERLGVLG